MGRAAVFARDGHACVACGATEGLTIDHVIPKSRGGSDDDGNKQTLCRGCNQAKGSLLPEEWTAPLRRSRPSALRWAEIDPLVRAALLARRQG